MRLSKQDIAGSPVALAGLFVSQRGRALSVNRPRSQVKIAPTKFRSTYRQKLTGKPVATTIPGGMFRSSAVRERHHEE